MKDFFRILIVCLFFGLNFGSSLHAQYASILKAADSYFNTQSYALAIDRYEEYLQKDSTNNAAIAHLAESYRVTNQHAKAVRWFSKLDQRNAISDDDRFLYAQSLMQQNNYAEAKKQFDLYGRSSMVHGLQADNLIKDIDNRGSLLKDSSMHQVRRTNFNSENADYGPVVLGDKIIFSSSRSSVKPINTSHSWTNKSFYKLFFVKGNLDSTSEDVTVYFKDINSKYNDGPVCFSGDGNIMYVTRNRIDKRKEKGTIRLEIMQVGKDEKGNFSSKKMTPFQYNNKEYNVAHPSVSKDGKYFYFSSDMPGGSGGMDLYVCMADSGGWSKPRNLGSIINSMGNDVFPFIDPSGYLFYSSNGLGGLGGLDIYEAQGLGNSRFKKPTNLGYPINSSHDDLGIHTDSSGRKGFISSNRGNEGLDDDIYFFQSTKPRIKTYTFESYDSLFAKKLDTVFYSIKDQATGTSIDIASTGSIQVELLPGKKYEIKASSAHYKNRELNFFSGAETLTRIAMQRNVNKHLNVVVYNNNRDVTPLKLATILIKNKQGKEDVLLTDSVGTLKDVLLPCENEYTITAQYAGRTTPSVFESTVNLNEDTTVSHMFYMEMLKDVCLKGFVYEKNQVPGLKVPLDSVLLSFEDASTGAKIGDIYSNKDGSYSFCELFPNKKYNIHVHKYGYFVQINLLDTKNQRKGATIIHNFEIDKIVIGKAIKLEKIYFNVGKWDIRPDAAKELDKVVKLLRENPDLVIELSSHTDCRGTASANRDLSSNRAKSSSEYIIKNGVEEYRVIGTGYGERKPVNKCECEGSLVVPCTEKEHQANRRTEFRVVGYVKNGKVYFDPSLSKEMESSEDAPVPDPAGTDTK